MRSLIVLPRAFAPFALAAALASIVPAAIWCPAECGPVDVAELAACDTGACAAGGSRAQATAACPLERACSEARSSTACSECGRAATNAKRECPMQTACASGPVFCLESPTASHPAPVAPGFRAPPALPAELAADVSAPPPHAVVYTRPNDDARPTEPPRDLPPPVRGPPLVA